MLKAELLTVLNAEAAQLGVGEVTPSMFDDWVEEGLIGGPTPKGRRRGQNPLWEYSAGTTERALSILRLKAEHVTRFAALRLQLWLRGHELPPSCIKEDLNSEFERLLKRHFFRGLLWSYDARDPTADSFEERQRHKRKLPPVDSTLEAAGLKPSEDSILALGSKMFWGPDRKTNSFEVLAGELSQKLGGVPVRPLLADLQPYISCAAGILGNPEEIEKSGLSELDDIEFEDLNSGRIPS